MKFSKAGDKYIIKVERGEELHPTLIAFCKEQNIKNAHFSAIGAADNIVCGYYALAEKKYYFKTYNELNEVVSMTGNVMLKNGEPMLHVHGVFTGVDNLAFGGHVDSLRVGVVLEVILEILPTAINRELDNKIGLFLINCPN